MAFAGYLKQSTAVDILIGPFIDDTDGKTAETGLTLDVEVSKNGQALANKSDATAPSHDAAGTVDGYYNCELDATDTGTLGILTVVAHAAGFLPVRLDYQIVTANWWDTMCSTDQLDVNVTNIEGSDPTDQIRDAVVDDATRLDASSLNAIEAKVDTVDTNVDAILVDTGTTLDAALAVVDGIVDSILADTGTDGVVLANDAITAAKIAANAIGASEIADAAIDAATFASGAITADAIAANAIGASEIAADAIDASAIAANAIGASELATDAVAEIADGVWDEAASGHITAGTFGQRLAIVRAATAQAGAAGSITLDASASATDAFYDGQVLHITAGTGAGQSRRIDTYTGASKVATISPNWGTNPGADSVFVIHPEGDVPGASAPTAATVADAVWDEAAADHVAAGSFGVQAGTDIDAILADTNELQTDDYPTTIAAVKTDTAAILADTGTDGVILASIATGAITADAIAANAIGASEIATDAIAANEIAASAANKIADHVIRRTFQNACDSANGDAKIGRSLLGAIAKLVNKVSISGSTLTVTEDDDVTSLFTQSITTDAAADPIIGLDT